MAKVHRLEKERLDRGSPPEKSKLEAISNPQQNEGEGGIGMDANRGFERQVSSGIVETYLLEYDVVKSAPVNKNRCQVYVLHYVLRERYLNADRFVMLPIVKWEFVNTVRGRCSK